MKQAYDLHRVHTTILLGKKVYQPHSNNIYQLYNNMYKMQVQINLYYS